jgi:hypothetical protein
MKAVRQRKEIHHQMIGNLVVMLAVRAEPINRPAKLAVIESDQPAVIDAYE